MFEDEIWLHDHHHEFNSTDGNRLNKLFSAKEITQAASEEAMKIQDNEELVVQYIYQIDLTTFVVFPLRESVFVGRGLILTLEKQEKNYMINNIELIAAPPVELCRPGIKFHQTRGQLSDILFIGGNEANVCYNYNLKQKGWVTAGKLPKQHTVTEHINFGYGDQTMSIYVQVNFQDNCFQFMMATNQGNVGAKESSEEWNWLV